MVRKRIWLAIIVSIGLATILAVYLGSLPVKRQVPQEALWESGFDRGVVSPDIPLGLITTPAGDCIAAGTGFMVRFDAKTGRRIWDKGWDGILVGALASDPVGNPVVAGEVRSEDPSGPPDTAIAKYSIETGSRIWMSSRPVRGNEIVAKRALCVDAKGDVVSATALLDGDRCRHHLAKYRGADGTVAWQKGDGFEEAGRAGHGVLELKIGGNGDIILLTLTKGKEPYFLIRVLEGADGSLKWERKEDALTSWQMLEVDRNGDVILAGFSAADNAPVSRCAKLSGSDGRLLWSATVAVHMYKRFRYTGLTVDTPGDVILRGYYEDVGGAVNSDQVFKLSGSNGGELWNQSSTFPAGDRRPVHAFSNRKVTCATDGNYVLSDSLWNGRDFDFHLKWLAADSGKIMKDLAYQGPADMNDVLFLTASSPDNTIIAAGISSNCRGWQKPLRELNPWIPKGKLPGAESSDYFHVYQDDPYNYDLLVIKAPDPSRGSK